MQNLEQVQPLLRHILDKSWHNFFLFLNLLKWKLQLDHALQQFEDNLLVFLSIKTCTIQQIQTRHYHFLFEYIHTANNWHQELVSADTELSDKKHHI